MGVFASDGRKGKGKCAGAKLQTKLADKRSSFDFFEFSQIVTKYCNISVRVTPDAIAQIENPTSVAQAANAMTQAPVVPNVLAFPQAGAASRPGAQNANLIDINYKGNLTGLLEIVTARFGILWKFEEGKNQDLQR
ncbi:hypothetical protein ACFS07_35675 [Undibacterium arcticum]